MLRRRVFAAGRRVQGKLRRRSGRAPALARRFRAAQGRSGGARQARARRRRTGAREPGPRTARRPRAERREGPPARTLRRLGARPRLVARPHGAHLAPARGAHDPRLARLVCDLEQRRRLAEADAEPEPAVPRARHGLVPGAAARGHEGPRDAALAERQRQLEVGAERELRAGDDGALHARRGPRLHRVRRPPAGARADRLPERLEARGRERQLPL